jgi:hypothetical protein
MTDGEWRVQSVATTEEGVRRNGAQWWREEDNVVIIVGPRKRHRGPDTGSNAGNVCSRLYIYILRMYPHTDTLTALSSASDLWGSKQRC